MRTLLLIISAVLLASAGIPGVQAPHYDGPSRVPEIVTEHLIPVTHAETLQPGIPVRLDIPAINLSTALEQVGLRPDRKPDTPKSPFHAGWYDLGPRPGEEGAAVILGVLDQKGGPAVFYHLRKLKTGDVISVNDDEEREQRFVVERTKLYDVRTAPLKEIYTAKGKRLHLITCAGTWDKDLDHYDQRLVVFASLEVQEGALGLSNGTL